jgi:hypothetical protein
MSFSAAAPELDEGTVPGAAPGQILIVGRSAGGGHPDWADIAAAEAATIATKTTTPRFLMSTSPPSTNRRSDDRRRNAAHANPDPAEIEAIRGSISEGAQLLLQLLLLSLSIPEANLLFASRGRHPGVHQTNPTALGNLI